MGRFEYVEIDSIELLGGIAAGKASHPSDKTLDSRAYIGGTHPLVSSV
jgi:hypothetical protein